MVTYRQVLAIFALLLPMAFCTYEGPYCKTNEQCVIEGRGDTCLSTGLCIVTKPGADMSSTSSELGTTTDMTPAWKSIGAGVYAYAGKVGGIYPKPSQRCKDIGSTCAPAKDAGKVNLSACDALPGFHVADVIADENGSSLMCGAGPGITMLCGCGGRLSSAIKSLQCSTFQRCIRCDGSDGWRCPVTMLESASSTSEVDGVICYCS